MSKRSIIAVFNKVVVHDVTTLDVVQGEMFTLHVIGASGTIDCFTNHDSVLDVTDLADGKSFKVLCHEIGNSTIELDNYKLTINVIKEPVSELVVKFNAPTNVE